MKAVRLLEYGGSLVFNDVPTPTIARDEILVKVKSTAVNHEGRHWSSEVEKQAAGGRMLMSDRLSGKVCVITGTGGSVGRGANALAFARRVGRWSVAA